LVAAEGRAAYPNDFEAVSSEHWLTEIGVPLRKVWKTQWSEPWSVRPVFPESRYLTPLGADLRTREAERV